MPQTLAGQAIQKRFDLHEGFSARDVLLLFHEREKFFGNSCDSLLNFLRGLRIKTRHIDHPGEDGSNEQGRFREVKLAIASGSNASSPSGESDAPHESPLMDLEDAAMMPVRTM
ncbi:MAG: hypothetical protein ACR2FY_06540 [Pirellulaceae bacterium]